MKRILWIVAPVVLLLLMLYFSIGPYLSVNKPVDTNVLVIEGWIDDQNLQAAAELVEQGGYEHVITTGTFRSFAYYLEGDQRLQVTTERPVHKHIAVEAAGVPDARLIICNGEQDTLLDVWVPGDVRTFHANFNKPTSKLTFSSYHHLPSADTTAIVFIRDVKTNDGPLHSFCRVEREEGGTVIGPGTPTHAHAAAERLMDLGVPKRKIVIAPARIGPEGRTISNARAASAVAKELGWRSFNVISEGVHARRSWNAYCNEMGPRTQVGVIAFPDAETETGTRLAYWRKVGKELMGMLR